MKKFLFVTALIICVLVFFGCTSSKNNYDVINELIKADYSSVKLEVTTTLDGESLKGEYSTTATTGGYKVDYRYEQLNSFAESDGDIVIPDEYKTTYSGSATVVDGKVTSQTGDETDIPLERLTATRLSFSASYFSDVQQRDGDFFAKVTDVKGFFGQAISASNMTVTVKYTAESLNSVTIRYRSGNGAQIIMIYSFKR